MEATILDSIEVIKMAAAVVKEVGLCLVGFAVFGWQLKVACGYRTLTSSCSCFQVEKIELLQLCGLGIFGYAHNWPCNLC